MPKQQKRQRSQHQKRELFPALKAACSKTEGQGQNRWSTKASAERPEYIHGTD